MLDCVLARRVQMLRMRRCEISSSEGRLEEVEREKVEEQVAIYVRSCTANIAKLEALIERAEGATPQVNVYQHGVVSTAILLSCCYFTSF